MWQIYFFFQPNFLPKTLWQPFTPLMPPKHQSVQLKTFSGQRGLHNKKIIDVITSKPAFR